MVDSCVGNYFDATSIYKFELFCQDNYRCRYVEVNCTSDLQYNKKCKITCNEGNGNFPTCEGMILYSYNGISDININGNGIDHIIVYCGINYDIKCTVLLDGTCAEGFVDCFPSPTQTPTLNPTNIPSIDPIYIPTTDPTITRDIRFNVTTQNQHLFNNTIDCQDYEFCHVTCDFYRACMRFTIYTSTFYESTLYLYCGKTSSNACLYMDVISNVNTKYIYVSGDAQTVEYRMVQSNIQALIQYQEPMNIFGFRNSLIYSYRIFFLNFFFEKF